MVMGGVEKRHCLWRAPGMGMRLMPTRAEYRLNLACASSKVSQCGYTSQIAQRLAF